MCHMADSFVLTKKIGHIAFIMDGNGRWAKLRGLPRHLGHKEACGRLREIFDACLSFGINAVSFFAFSTENWNRPQDEIDHLMDYLEDFFSKEIDAFEASGTRILISGDLSRLRESSREAALEAMRRTAKNAESYLNICLNYGGRDEIVRAAKKFASEVMSGRKDVSSLTEETFKNYLWQPSLPDVDLMIRTSGEERISNFLLYEIAYAELVFTPVKWPDFHKADLIDCLMEFQKRDRRYGGLSK